MTATTTAPGVRRVSVIIPSRNEMARWPAVVAMLRAQTRQPDEIVVADGMSDDGSREWLDRLAQEDDRWVVLDNTARVVPDALNLALHHATGDVVARMDTHADYAPDYLQTVVGVLEDRPDVAGVGGAMATAGRGPWGRAIAAVLGRPFGLGGARHRVDGAAGPIQHVFSGCYRRERLLAIGGWDTRLHANEDFEADVRLGAAGGTLWLEPRATSTWYVRETPRALAVQMWRYGHHKGLTLLLHPDSLRLRQLAPPLLVVGLAVGALVRPRATVAPLVAYLLGVGALGVRAAREDGASPLRTAVVPPIVHVCWGAGLIAGLLRFAPVARRRGPGGPTVPAGAPPHDVATDVTPVIQRQQEAVR